MARLLLLLFSLLPLASSTCTNGFTQVSDKCLRLFTTEASYSSAESTCASYGGTLATVKNAIENRAISSFVGTSVSHIWLGIYCAASDPGYCYWSDDSGSAAAYSNFARSFPYTDVGKCVYYTLTGNLAGQWISAICSDELNPFVCELPTTQSDSCAYNYNGYCYYPSFTFFNSLVPFGSAQQVCQNYGMTLVTINSTNEMRFIKTIPVPPFSAGVSLNGDFFATQSSNIWTASTVDYFLCKRQAGYYNPPTMNPSLPTTPSPIYPPTCNSTLMAPATFTSPNFPNAYDNNLYCTYTLATPGINKIFLDFPAFLTESCCDKVYVYDGDSVNSPLLRTLAGNLNTPISIQSSGNQLFVVFTTDGSVTYTGFSANFIPII